MKNLFLEKAKNICKLAPTWRPACNCHACWCCSASRVCKLQVAQELHDASVMQRTVCSHIKSCWNLHHESIILIVRLLPLFMFFWHPDSNNIATCDMWRSSAGLQLTCRIPPLLMTLQARLIIKHDLVTSIPVDFTAVAVTSTSELFRGCCCF